MSGHEQLKPPAAIGGSAVEVIGAKRQPFRDLYHHFLRMPWWQALGAIVAVMVALNALFALGFVLTGGVANARPGVFRDAFYFSAQTMHTIGYGSMYPVSDAANVLVVAEALVGMLTAAVATGLVFAKFSQSSGRIVFSRLITISPMDGVPTLTFRVGNERGNQIVEATLRVAMVRTERTREGMVFYRLIDLPLTRERSPAVSRSWTVMHPLDEKSPLRGATPGTLASWDVEFIVSLVGTDDTSLQPVHARHTYGLGALRWGARPADVLSERPDGTLLLDIRKFHDVVPTEPTDDFPYPARGA